MPYDYTEYIDVELYILRSDRGPFYEAAICYCGSGCLATVRVMDRADSGFIYYDVEPGNASDPMFTHSLGEIMDRHDPEMPYASEDLHEILETALEDGCYFYGAGTHTVLPKLVKTYIYHTDEKAKDYLA